MKAKNVFATFGLALAMSGSLAAAGILSMSKEVKPAEAWPSSDWATPYVVGSFAESGWSTFLPLEKGASGDYERVIDLAADDEFKFTNQANFDGIVVNRTWGQITDQGTDSNCWKTYTDDAGGDNHNFKIKAAGKYRVYMEADAVEGSWGEAEYGLHIDVPVEVTCVVADEFEGQTITYKQYLPAGGGALADYQGENRYAWYFFGWYSDAAYTAGNEVTTVTSSTTVYGRFAYATQKYFGFDGREASNLIRSAAFRSGEIYRFSWDKYDRAVGTFPGSKMCDCDANVSFNVPEGTKLILSNGSDPNAEGFAQTVDIDPTGIPAGDKIVILNETDLEGHYKVTWASLLDEPANDGYYLASSKSDFKYAGATKLTDIEPDIDNNIAIIFGYEGTAGEKVKVRYFNASEGKDLWATNASDPTEIGDFDADGNFEFAQNASIDVFVKWVKTYSNPDIWKPFFFVVPHAVRHPVHYTNVLFEGKVKTGTETGPYRFVPEGKNFVPSTYSREGYSFWAFYTDEDCTVYYEPFEVKNDSVVLYARFEKLGYYVTGDAAFTGSVDTEWQVTGATSLTREVNDPANFLEGSITIPASASEDPVSVRLFENTESSYEWMTCALGATYSFASVDGNNIAFTKGGTYAIYMKYVEGVPTIWLNEGLPAFNTKFITDIGGICNGILNNTKDLDDLKATWLELKGVYQSLSAEEKANFTDLSIDSGDENGSDLQKVIAKYSYIVHKYGTANFEDYIWGGTYAAQTNSVRIINENSNVMFIVLVATAIMTISATGLFFIIRKKRFEK